MTDIRLASLVRDRRFFFASKDDIPSTINEPLKKAPNSRFTDDGSYATVKLVGQVADYVIPRDETYFKLSTAMGDFGDTDVTTNPNYTPITDGDAVRGRLVLECFEACNKELATIWKDQCDKLAQVIAGTNNDFPPSSKQKRHDTFIKELFPGSIGDTAIEILWEKFTSRTGVQDVVEWRDCSRVKESALYHPRVIDHYGTPAMGIKDDLLKQLTIYDEWGHLIPPWHLLAELRPGSIVVIDAVLVPYDSPMKSGYSDSSKTERIFKAYGRCGQIVERGSLKYDLNKGPAENSKSTITQTPVRKKRTARMSTGGKPPKKHCSRSYTTDRS